MKKNNFLFIAMVTLLVAFVACKSDKTADGSATSATTPAADPNAPAPTPGAETAPAAPTGPTTTVEFETISAEYHKYLLGYEQAVTYSSRDTIRQGVLKGVMPDGRIWLEGEWGKELFANGETSLTY